MKPLTIALIWLSVLPAFGQNKQLDTLLIKDGILFKNKGVYFVVSVTDATFPRQPINCRDLRKHLKSDNRIVLYHPIVFYPITLSESITTDTKTWKDRPETFTKGCNTEFLEVNNLNLLKIDFEMEEFLSISSHNSWVYEQFSKMDTISIGVIIE